MKIVLYIALGGSLGAVARYLISKQLNNLFPFAAIPIGTLAVNVIGALIIGFLIALFDNYLISSEIKAFLTIGFLGALTTFSTFSLETVNLIRQNEYAGALISIALNNLLCFAMVIAGSFLFNLLIKIAKQE